MIMKKYKITSLELSKLDHASFSQLMTESSSAIDNFVKKNKDLLYVSKNEALKPLLQDFQAGLHRSRASQVSDKLEEADKGRDAAFMTLTSLVRAFSRVSVPETAAAYQRLSDLLKNYKQVATASYEKETEAISHLLGQLAKEEYQAALTTLHLYPHYDELRRTQSVFAHYYFERLQEQKTVVKSNSKALRAEMQEIYEFLVDFTAINAYAYPEKTGLADLRDQLNTIRNRYKVTQTKKPQETKDDLDQ